MSTMKLPALRPWAAALLLGLSGGWALAQPLLIAHRGASGHRPEHTLAAYQLAIEQGADCIEPDLVMSKDGVLLARHEPLLARVELEADGRTIKRGADGKPVLHRTDTSSNVWQLDKYADRLTVKQVDGRPMAGWFAEDFTAAEIRADVRAQERLRDLRLANRAYDDREPIPTLDEVIALAQARGVCLYPETKHPSYFKAFTEATGLPRMEDTLLKALHAAWGNRPEAPVFIQSFEVANLQYLRGKTQLRLVQLLSAGGKPYDFTLAGRCTRLRRSGPARGPGLHQGLRQRHRPAPEPDHPAAGPAARGRAHAPGGRGASPRPGGAWLDLPRREQLPAQGLPEQRRQGARRPGRYGGPAAPLPGHGHGRLLQRPARSGARGPAAQALKRRGLLSPGPASA